jgi:hypothetical protein
MSTLKSSGKTARGAAGFAVAVGWLAVFGAAALAAAARPGESSTSWRMLRPYIHEGEWEMATILDAPGATGKRQEPQTQRDCLTIAKAESLLKQCGDGAGCHERACSQKVEPLGPHAARIRVSCLTTLGASLGDFTYRWDSWVGTVQVIRDGRALLSMRMSGLRVGDCPQASP